MRRRAAGLAAVLGLLGVNSTLWATTALTNSWTGGSLTSSNWSDTANWSGGALVNFSNVVFGVAKYQTNYDDLASLSVTNLIFTNAGWSLGGSNGINLNGTYGFIFDNAVGTNVLGMNITNNGGINLYQNALGDVLNLTGVISGSGGITKNNNQSGTLILSNPNSTFSGRVMAACGNLIFYSIAPSYTKCSLGYGYSGNGTMITVGQGTTPIGALTYMGTNSSVTDRAPLFQSYGAFTNNSPNNSSLTWGGHVTVNQYTAFTTILSGSSTGTNTFNGVFGDAPAFTGGTYTGGSLQISGPGTWVFNNLIYFTNNLTVASGSHVVWGPTNSPTHPALFPNNNLYKGVTIASGATLDVSAFDANGITFALGWASGYPQTMTIGHTNGTTTDLNGSLSLAPSSLGVPAGNGTLIIAGSGTAGALNINGNFIPGLGSLMLDVGPSPASGSDVINVSGNVDLSQGPATLDITVLGSIQTGVPYTLINYTGTLIGDGSGLTTFVTSPAYSATVVDPTTTPGQIQVIFASTGLPDFVLWQGGVSGNWDVATTANWLSGASGADFMNEENVVFDDSSSQTNVSLVGSVLPYSVVFSNNINSYLLSGSGNLAGGSLLMQGNGALTITGVNTYPGGTVISAGTLVASNNYALGTGNVTLGDTNSGTNAINLVVDNWINNNITVSSNATGPLCLMANPGTNIIYLNTLALQNNLIISNSSSTVNSLIIADILGSANWTVYGGGGVKLQGSNYPSGSLGTVTVLPTPGNSVSLLNVNVQLNTNVNVNLAGASTQYGVANNWVHGINVLAGNGTLLNSPGQTGNTTVTLGTANGSGTFSGVFATNANGGAGSYFNTTKIGTGTQTLTGDSTGFPGNTTVNGGVLAINNTTGSGLGFGGVTVNVGGTLAGSGSINEFTNGVAVSGGTLMVGNAGDTTGSSFTLTCTNALRFTANGVLAVNLYSGAGTGSNTGNAAAADVLKAQCPVLLTNTATLTVGNPNGMTTWAAGDQWRIANWVSTVTGTFTATNLPTLPSSLAWNLTNLYSTGVISIVSAAPVLPTHPANITGICISSGNLIITGTNMNGGANFHYLVRTSPSLATPLTNWTVLCTNVFNADGTFNYTNANCMTNGMGFFDTQAVP
jgi:autotransporter-associated beta strand protein